MQFATRNSIVLGVLVVLIILIGGYWTRVHQPETLSSLEEQIKKLDVELNNTPDLQNVFNTVQAELAYWEKRWNSRTKDIPTADVTGATNAYFNSVILSSGRVNADVAYVGMKQEPKYGYNIYSLRGEAPFHSLFRFIWYLENGRRLFKFNKLVFRGTTARDPGEEEPHPTVQFELELRAYFTSLSELSSSVAWRDTTTTYLAHNPFWPIIRPEVPKNIEGLVEVERSELKAVIPGKAFITDQTGKSRTLSVGDNVYLGYLSKIIPEEGKVEFILNKGGISETFIMKVKFRQTETEGKK